jgi:PAS domain S-box-containing protein
MQKMQNILAGTQQLMRTLMATNMSFVSSRQLITNGAVSSGEFQDLVDVLQKIVRNAGALLEVSSCSVALVDVTGTTLVTLAALASKGHRPRQTRFRVKEGVAGWVAEHREPLVINNVSLDTRFKRLGRIPVGSMMCVPLIDQETFIGTLTASSEGTGAFDEKKAKMLTIFAEQAVLAIVNARHADLARHQANQLEMLIDLSRGITMRLAPEELYRTILADVKRLIECDRAVIYLYRESAQELHAVAEWPIRIASIGGKEHAPGAPGAGGIARRISFYDEQAITAWAAVHRHPMLQGPMQGVQREEGEAGTSEQEAEMAIPLVSKDILYGVLTLNRKEAFSSEELRLMRNLGSMVTAALENVDLFQKVRAEQEELRAILSSSSDGIALLDKNACFIETNEAFGRIFDMEPAQVIGMECIELLGQHEEDGRECDGDHCKIKKALQCMEALPSAEIEWQRQDNSHAISVSITPVATTHQPISLLVARDVTATRDASRMKAKFLSMIAHELRSPLNAINGYLDLTLEGLAGDLNGQQREFLQRARAGSEHLYALIEDLLLVTRADAGQLKLNREIIRLQDVLIDGVEEMELTARDAGVSINVDIDKNFPRLWADAGRLRQVLRNLLSNALRFTPREGQISIIAEIVREAAEGENDDDVLPVAKLCVKDTGNGIAPEHHERIFERFYQIHDGHGNRASGQGLGLAIVRMIIELHGGRVEVESSPGEGSTFTCTLPCMLA